MAQEYWQREVDGKIERKLRKSIVAVWTDENGNEWQSFNNPKDEQLIAAGWTKCVVQEVTEEELLKRAKHRKKIEIQRYDKSSNDFSSNE